MMGKSLSTPRVNGSRALLALGANLRSPAGGPRAAVLAALAAIAADPQLSLVAVSRLFASPAHPAGSGPDYVNAAAAITTALPPEALLARLHGIEAAGGRARDPGTARWSARVIDIDLLAMDDLVRPDAAGQDEWRALPAAAQRTQAPDRLILPHPRLQDRGFVLAPLADIAPMWQHPRIKVSVAQMLAALPPEALDGVQPLAPRSRPLTNAPNIS